MNKLFLIIALLLVSAQGFPQKHYEKYEGQEFLRQVQLTKEYKTAKEKADQANLDTGKVPQEVKFIIIRQQEVGLDPDTLIGKLTRKLAIGITLESYQMLYDRNRRKIVSIIGGENKSIQMK